MEEVITHHISEAYNERFSFSVTGLLCDDSCPKGKYELTQDSNGDGAGCFIGCRVYCCDE
jgi:hypothetical protein